MAEFVANYDEDEVPDYSLPDPLIFEDGTKVESAAMWERRRVEILSLFESQVYGKMPGAAAGMHFETRCVNEDALDGIRKEVRVHFMKDAEEPWMDILIFLPKDADGPVPLFVGLNFGGNHTVHPDPEIALSEQWMRSKMEGAEIIGRRKPRVVRLQAGGLWGGFWQGGTVWLRFIAAIWIQIMTMGFKMVCIHFLIGKMLGMTGGLLVRGRGD